MLDQVWRRSWQAVALIRERGWCAMFEDFEYLATTCEQWLNVHPRGTYPTDAPRFDFGTGAWTRPH